MRSFLRWTTLRPLVFRFARMAFLLLVGVWIGLGLMSSATSGNSKYDPALFAIGLATLFAFLSTFAAFLIHRNRVWRARALRMQRRNGNLSERILRLQRANDRERNFLDLQGDLIVRRNRHGMVSFANEAFCLLTGESAASLRGSEFSVRVLEQGDVATLPNGSCVYDQMIATPSGPRWIAWHESAVRADDGESEIQCVGRDVTDRMMSEAALADARDQSEAANRAKSRFL
ncbi:MAG: hybrid sensor histidine kinase/response regulator, partial [Pseudorhodoplanes sp.]